MTEFHGAQSDGMSQPAFAQVAVDGVPLTMDRGVLTYAIPEHSPTVPAIGQVIWVPFRNRLVHGLVVGLTDAQPEFVTKPIGAVVEPPIVLSAESMETVRWMAETTVSTIFSCAALFFPPGRQFRSTEVYRLSPHTEPEEARLTATQKQVVALLAEHQRLSVEQLREMTGKTLTTVLPKLVADDVVLRELVPDERVPGRRLVKRIRLVDRDAPLHPRATKQRAILDALIELSGNESPAPFIAMSDIQTITDTDAATLDRLLTTGAIDMDEVPATETPEPRTVVAPELTADQASAWKAIETALRNGDATPNLLFGVTGSGKTELYLRTVAWCRRHHRQAIILVPEIGLATQVVRRFIDRFPGRVAVLHSQMTQGERYDIWQQIRAGELDVIVGPRSALFAPVPHLGAIVLDEEHDASYKQDSEPRYHARTVAEHLAALQGVPLILGSATPSVESMAKAQDGTWRLLQLPHRVAPGRGSQPLSLPDVEIVDMRDELRAGHVNMLSRPLIARVNHSLEHHEQSILLLNRRGSSTIVLCRNCGQRLECPNCDIPLVYHGDRRELICHRCDFRMLPPQRGCPECGGQLDYFGAGTQRIEDEVRRTFPDARVLRWDADAVRAAGGHSRLLEAVENGAADIIVGTQMVSKGFDLPHVTTIGVIAADSLLHLPDFRSSERTFQLLTQMAGRAGRRGPGSTVVFQTYTPDHYAIQAASRHDYMSFYRDEVAFRQQLRYPPVERLVRFLTRNEREQAAALEAGLYARDLARHASHEHVEMDMLGPSPAFEARNRGVYQWQIVMRSPEMDRLLTGMPLRTGWVIDVDPESML